MKLSRRLEKALEYTKSFYCLRDVGCDHAYLSIEAVSRGYVTKSVASDNKVSPLEHAKKNVKSSALEDSISVRLLEGLDELDASQDLVSILGMGGILIRDILEGADMTNVKRLILSPNSDASVVRDFLEDHHFEITDEAFIKDRNKYYQIIVASHGEMTYSKLEKRFGRKILAEKNQDFIEYVEKQIKKLEQALSHSKDETKSRLLDEINTWKECL